MSKHSCAVNLSILAEELIKAEVLGDLEPAAAAATRELTATASLTGKQGEVLILLLRNLSSEEILKEMGITAWTLRSHRQQIVKKTGLRIGELLRSLRRSA